MFNFFGELPKFWEALARQFAKGGEALIKGKKAGIENCSLLGLFHWENSGQFTMIYL